MAYRYRGVSSKLPMDILITAGGALLIGALKMMLMTLT